MSIEENKARLRRIFEEGWNQGSIAVLDDLLAPNYSYHSPTEPTVRTREDFKRYVTEIRSAYPDLHFTIDDLIAEGDQVVVRWTFRGTHTGQLRTPLPVPPTGKQVTATGIVIDRAANGKSVECWVNYDALGAYQQLGVILAPGQAS